METATKEKTAQTMTLRIDPELHKELSSRAAASGRPMTVEALRLIRKGLMLDQSLGQRAESGYDLMQAFAMNGAGAVIEALIQKGATPLQLREAIVRVEVRDRFDKLSPEEQHNLLYGIKP